MIPSSSFDPAVLTEHEKFVLARIAFAEWADFSGPEEKPALRGAFLRWLMLRLLASPHEGQAPTAWAVASTGVRIRGARIDGALDLSDAAGIDGQPLPALALEDCECREIITLNHARLARLSFKNSCLRGIRAFEAQIDGPLDLAGISPCALDGQPEQCWVRFNGSRIDGDVIAENARLVAEAPNPDQTVVEPPRYALSLARCEIAGRIWAKYLTAIGGVSLGDASVGGEVWLRGAHLVAVEGHALMAQSASFRSGLVADRCKTTQRNFQATGCIWLLGSQINGNVNLTGAQIRIDPNSRKYRSILATGAKISGSFFLRTGFRSEGTLYFRGARVQGDFDASSAQLHSRQNTTIDLRTAHVGGDFILENSDIRGGIALRRANVDGRLSFRQTKITGSFPAIVLVGSRIGGELDATGLVCAGGVDAQRLKIDGGLILHSARITSVDGIALDLTVASIGGGLLLSESGASSSLDGALVLSRAIVRGGFIAEAATLKPGKTARNAGVAVEGNGLEVEGDVWLGGAAEIARANIDGTVELCGAQFRRELRVANTGEARWLLGGASAANLIDLDGASWGGAGTTVDLDGFDYGGLAVNGSDEEIWVSRKAWLSRHVETVHPYRPQPYVHLAAVLRRQGHDQAARKALTHKRWREWREAEHWSTKWFSVWFGTLFSFGYSPGRAMATMVAAIGLGAFGTHFANQNKLLVVDTAPVATVAVRDGASSSPGIPSAVSSGAQTALPCGDAIQPALYAVDVFVPLIDLRQESKCEAASPPMDAANAGTWMYHPDFWRWAKSIYALLGWILTSLAILTFSGVLQRQRN